MDVIDLKHNIHYQVEYYKYVHSILYSKDKRHDKQVMYT